MLSLQVLTFQHPKTINDVFLSFTLTVSELLLGAVLLHGLCCNTQCVAVIVYLTLYVFRERTCRAMFRSKLGMPEAFCICFKSSSLMLPIISAILVSCSGLSWAMRAAAALCASAYAGAPGPLLLDTCLHNHAVKKNGTTKLQLII